MKTAEISFNGVTFNAEYDGENVTIRPIKLDVTDYCGVSKLSPRRFRYKLAVKETAAWAIAINRANNANRRARLRAGPSSILWAKLEKKGA